MDVEDSVAKNVKSGAGYFGLLTKELSSWRLIVVSLFVALSVVGVSTSVLAADATVTFTDQSDNELGFRIERNLNGGAFTALPLALPSNGVGLTVSVLDTTLVQSSTQDNKYCYRALAYNSAGDSPFATTATPGVTDCKTIARLIVIPTGPAGLLVK